MKKTTKANSNNTSKKSPVVNYEKIAMEMYKNFNKAEAID